jgi:hypothetical protein
MLFVILVLIDMVLISPRCVESGVSYLSSRVERIVEATNGHSLVACEHDIVVPCRYNGILLLFKCLMWNK